MVCNVLMLEECGEELKSEAVLLGIALLLGGNQETQQKFFEFFQQDDRNLVMLSIHRMIEENLSIIKIAMERKNKQLLDQFKKKDMGTSDRQERKNNLKLETEDEDESDPTIHTQEEQEFVTKKIAELTSSYRFLQLFCEGHYIEMQEYLRVQKQNGQINVKSINFIS